MRANSNAASGLVFLILGVLALTILIPYGIDSPPSLQFRALSPSFWPNTVSVVITVIGLALIASAVFAGSRRADQSETALGGERQNSAWLTSRPFLVMAICFLLYLALETFGFVLAPMITMAGLMVIGGERRVLLIAIVSVVTPLALYFFFTKATGVPIPAGILESLLLRI